MVDVLFSKEKVEIKIKEDINKYYERDEYALDLDKNIKDLCKKKKDLKDSEILGFIEQYDPYYKEEKYEYKREVTIFDFLKFDIIDNQFIKAFKGLKFETIFEKKLNEFLSKIISKIDNTFKFGIIIDLIDIEKIKGKVKDYLNQLKLKYENIVVKEIYNTTDDKKLDDVIKIIVKFVDLLFIQEDKDIEFLKSQIGKLNRKIKPLIYNELVRVCKDDKYQIMKEFIYNKFLEKEYLTNFNNIKNLIESLSGEDKKNFLAQLFKKCSFTLKKFYSKKENIKIYLIYELFERNILKRQEVGVGEIENTLIKIIEDLDGEIEKQQLEEFLENDENVVIKRLTLIQFVLKNYNPKEIYEKLKMQIEEINRDIQKLTEIKKSLSKFHRNQYLEEINTIKKIINDINKSTLNKYNNKETKTYINNLKNLEETCKLVDSVKEFKLFNIIYDEAGGKDQAERFNTGIITLHEIEKLINDDKNSVDDIYKKNKKLFDKIKDMVCNDESKADLLIEQMIDYYKIDKGKKKI